MVAFYFNKIYIFVFKNLFKILATTALLYLAHEVYRKRKFYSLLRKIPSVNVRFWDPLGHIRVSYVLRRLGLKKSPVSNDVYDHVGMCGFTVIFYEKGLCLVWQSLTPLIMVFRADTVKALLNNSTELKKAWFYDFFHEWLGTGLLTSDGEKWKLRRKLLTPTFHFDVLKDFLPSVNNQSEILIEILRNEVHKPFIDIVPYLSRCSLDIICETTLGVSANSQRAAESKYVTAVHQLSEEFFARTASPWYWPNLTFRMSAYGRRYTKNIKIVHEFTKKAIAQRKQEKLNKIEDASTDVRDMPKMDNVYRFRKRTALLDFLLEEHLKNNTFTEEDIREEVDTFTFEGHDTTSTGMSWAVYLIGLDPEIQEKLFEELRFIFGEDQERAITIADLSEMKYLECILKESQRLYPSVPYFARQLKEDLEIQGYIIPKDVTCGVFSYGLHRDPDVFPNPEKFDPDRFLPENTEGRDPFAYTPFSAGPRNCIGQRFAMMEMKVVLASIFRHYRVRSLDERDKVQVINNLILRPEKKLRIQLQKRML